MTVIHWAVLIILALAVGGATATAILWVRSVRIKRLRKIEQHLHQQQITQANAKAVHRLDKRLDALARIVETKHNTLHDRIAAMESRPSRPPLPPLKRD